MVKKICEHCGNEFEVHKYREKTARFCSKQCREKAQYLPGFDGESKICTECKLPKPLSEFWKGKTKCKGCLTHYNKNKYEENKDDRAEYSKKYRKENQEKILNREKKYRDKNPEQRAAANKRWKEQNPERVRELKRFSEQVRRCRKQDLPHDLTINDWKETLEYFNYECAYCGESHELEQEHLLPVAEGGGYTKDNIIPGCSACNKNKGSKFFEEWYIDSPHYTRNRLYKIVEFIERNTEESLVGND